MADPIFKVSEKGEIALILKDAQGTTLSFADAKTRLKAVVRWSNDGDGSSAVITETNGGDTCLVTPLTEGTVTVTASVDVFHPFTNVKTTLTDEVLVKFFNAITPTGVRVLVVESAK